jgi:hypothetical protein
LKIRADEHIAPKIVRAVRELVLAPQNELTHVREYNTARTADETWVPRFALEGGHAIISADRHILARPHQQAAIVASGLSCVILPHQWAQSRRHEQAAHILWWWPRIEHALETMTHPQFLKVPFDFGRGPLEQMRFRAAQVPANEHPG